MRSNPIDMFFIRFYSIYQFHILLWNLVYLKLVKTSLFHLIIFELFTIHMSELNWYFIAESLNCNFYQLELSIWIYDKLFYNWMFIDHIILIHWLLKRLVYSRIAILFIYLQSIWDQFSCKKTQRNIIQFSQRNTFIFIININIETLFKISLNSLY